MDPDHSLNSAGESVLRQSALGRTLCHWQPLEGGVSASVYQMGYLDEVGKRRDAVVRCHGDVDYARNSHLAADEFACVSALHQARLRVPRPLFLGADQSIFGRPFAVYEFVKGECITDADGLRRRVPAMASWLADLHKLDLACLNFQVSADNALLPRQSLRELSGSPDHEVLERQIRALLQRLPLRQLSGKPALLHGDYWSGNLLWQNETLVAVIDWEDFAVGDPLADLGCARLELLWAADEAAVRDFTESYLRARRLDIGDLAGALGYWDLCSVLPFANTFAAITTTQAERSNKRRALAGFIQRAAAALGETLNLGA